MTVKETRTASLLETNAKTSVDESKTDQNNFKERVVTPTFYVLKWKWQTILYVISFWL